MECTNSNDDCYFYYYSSCTKGDDCPYRHCVAALGTETVCTAWREGRCYRNNCKFRHMESRINRSSIPCYWENQPGGCRKPHCVFLHRKDRVIIHSSSEEQKLILPVSSQPHSPNSVDVVLESSKSDVPEVHSLSPPQLIEPLVVSLDEGEESDSESTASTPMKTSMSETSNSKFSKRLFTASKPSDFGIKTLEQIRMERIHRESEHFYYTDKIDGSDLGDNSELARLDKLHNESDSYYPTDPGMQNALSNEVTPGSREAELYQNASLYPLEMNNILHDNNETNLSQEEKPFVDNCLPEDDLSGDLRNKLKKRRRAELQASPIKNMPKKRVISLKKASNAVDGESPAVTVTFEKMTKEQGSDTSSVNEKEPKAKGALNFHIKTLDEIRKEKERKNDHMEQVLCPEYSSETLEQNFDWEENQSDLVDESQENSFSNGIRTSAPKRKLKRMPIEVYKIPQKVSKNEPNKDHKIKTSIKRPLPEEPIPTKYMKICESSVIVKRDCHQVDSVTESILTEECSKETNATEKKLTSSSKRLLLRRNNLTLLKNDCHTNDCLELKPSNMAEIPDEEHAESSNDLKCQISSSKNRSIPENSSFDLNKPHPLSAQDEDTIVGNSDVDLYTLPSPVMATKPEGRSLILSSAEDIDKLFSVCDADLSLGEVDCSTDKNSDDIFLELEMMIQS